MVRSDPDHLPVETAHGAVERAAQGDRAPGDGIEHGLGVGLRLADHAEDFAGGRLSIERLAECVVPLPELVEQPRVLDGDDRLVGEGLEQGDLLVRVWPRILPARGNGTDGDSFELDPSLLAAEAIAE